MADPLRNADHCLDGIGRGLGQGLRIVFHPLRDRFGNDVDVGRPGDFRQRRHLPHPDLERLLTVGGEGAEAAVDDIVMHESVSGDRFADVKVRSRCQCRRKTRRSGLFGRRLEIDRPDTRRQ